MAETSNAGSTRRKSSTTKAASARKSAEATAATKAAALEEAAEARSESSDNAGNGTQWREQASDFAQQAKTTARDAATTAKNTTGDALHGLSKLIAETSETVDAKLGPQYGDYARRAAETVAGAADSLDAKDIDQLAEEARNFVRKSPAVAIGAAAVVGFVLMRMMRGSSNES